jgi:nicotinate-nucleotide adenylyltransferase
LTEPLGLFGGTFDPVHFGHLRLAEEAIGDLGLGGVRWIPAGQPPHRGRPQVTGQQRLEMVLRSTAENAGFSVDASEVAAAAPSYTVHTLERLRGELGADRSLVLLVGADAFAGLPTWHRWRDLFNLAHIAVSQRPGFRSPPAACRRNSLPSSPHAGCPLPVASNRRRRVASLPSR